jgi:hypothetical protein
MHELWLHESLDSPMKDAPLRPLPVGLAPWLAAAGDSAPGCHVHGLQKLNLSRVRPSHFPAPSSEKFFDRIYIQVLQNLPLLIRIGQIANSNT